MAVLNQLPSEYGIFPSTFSIQRTSQHMYGRPSFSSQPQSSSTFWKRRQKHLRPVPSGMHAAPLPPVKDPIVPKARKSITAVRAYPNFGISRSVRFLDSVESHTSGTPSVSEPTFLTHPIPFSPVNSSSVPVLTPIPVRHLTSDLFEDVFADAPSTEDVSPQIHTRPSPKCHSRDVDIDNILVFGNRYEDAEEWDNRNHKELGLDHTSLDNLLKPGLSASFLPPVLDCTTKGESECAQLCIASDHSDKQFRAVIPTEVLCQAGKEGMALGTSLMDTPHMGPEFVPESMTLNKMPVVHSDSVATSSLPKKSSQNISHTGVIKTEDAYPSQIKTKNLQPTSSNFSFDLAAGPVEKEASSDEVRTPRRAITAPTLSCIESNGGTSSQFVAKQIASLDASSISCGRIGQFEVDKPLSAVLVERIRKVHWSEETSCRRSYISSEIELNESSIPERTYLNNHVVNSESLSVEHHNDFHRKADDTEREPGSGRICNSIETDSKLEGCRKNNGNTPRFSPIGTGKKRWQFGKDPSSMRGSSQSMHSVIDRLSLRFESLTSFTNSNTDTGVTSVVKQALYGRASLGDVLEAIEACPIKLVGTVESTVHRYLSSMHGIGSSMALLLDELPEGYDVPLMSGLDSEKNRLRRHRDLLVHLYLSAPSTVRRAFFANSDARLHILQFFIKHPEPKKGPELLVWKWRASAFAKLLIAALEDRTSETTEMLSTNVGSLNSMAKHFCSVPEVCNFLVRLCVADAPGVSGDIGNDRFRVGAANGPGILLLDKERVPDMLIQTFVSACETDLQREEGALWLIRITGATNTLFEVCRRVMLLPRFSRGNCTYGAKYIVMVNCVMGLLGLWGVSKGIGRLLDVALDVCLSQAGDILCDAGQSDSARVSVVNRSLPLITVLNQITELLGILHDGKTDCSAAVKRAVENADIGPIVRCVIARGNELLDVVESGSSLSVKVAIIELMAVLLKGEESEAVEWFISKNVPIKLLSIVEQHPNCCVLHAAVVSCVELGAASDVEHKFVYGWVGALTRSSDWKWVWNDREKMQWSVLSRIVGALGKFWDEKLETDGVTRGFGERLRSMQKWAAEEIKACGGPKPEGPKVCILSNAASLAARINDVEAV